MTLPTRPRVHIETFGCTFNQSDSEVLAGLLVRAGYDLADSPDSADAVIVNSCTVKDRTLCDVRKRLAHLSGPGRPAVVLAGCVPRVYQQSREFAAFAQLGPDNLADAPEVVARALRGERVVRVGRSEAPRLSLPYVRRNPAVEIIPINKGCLGSCTFCQTVIARGRLFSFPEDEILERVARAESTGARIVCLTSQDCGAYGLDRGSNLPRLLRRIADLPGDFRVRLGMANPDLIKLYLDELVDALAHPRFFRFAHVPVQSGSDAVLAAMNRLYTADDFRRIVEALRRRIPDITIATDIITGFPTETAADFEASLALIGDLRIPVVNRSRFSPRPGTRAARLAPLPAAVSRERSRRMATFHRRLAGELLWAQTGRTARVIVESNPRPGVAMARDDAYRPIILRGEFRPGDRLDAHLFAAEGFHLLARPGAGDQ